MPPNVLSVDLKSTDIIGKVQNVPSPRDTFPPKGGKTCEDELTPEKGSNGEDQLTKRCSTEATQLPPKKGFIDENPKFTPIKGTFETQLTSRRSYEIVWLNVAVFVYYHLAAFYGIYLCFTAASWKMIAFTILAYIISGLGVTAGGHRLWSHKTYKAKMPLQIFLMLCQSSANQNTAIHWARNHRLHHKFSDTDADPHNSLRGFFFSHVGWVMVKKHPEARKKMKTLDFSDLNANPVLRFQQKHASWLIPVLAFVIPTVIPYLWGESYSVSFHMNMLRFILTLHATFLVNSVAHMWGYRPYDKTLKPAENFTVSFLTLGEGFHNYHHVFPHDYKTAELGGIFWNPTTIFIDFCAMIGQAYDRKTVSNNEINNRIIRTGKGL